MTASAFFDSSRFSVFFSIQPASSASRSNYAAISSA
jgi:hypothetical protein